MKKLLISNKLKKIIKNRNKNKLKEINYLNHNHNIII